MELPTRIGKAHFDHPHVKGPCVEQLGGGGCPARVFVSACRPTHRAGSVALILLNGGQCTPSWKTWTLLSALAKCDAGTRPAGLRGLEPGGCGRLQRLPCPRHALQTQTDSPTCCWRGHAGAGDAQCPGMKCGLSDCRWENWSWVPLWGLWLAWPSKVASALGRATSKSGSVPGTIRNPAPVHGVLPHFVDETFTIPVAMGSFVCAQVLGTGAGSDVGGVAATSGSGGGTRH